ncbi:hypothetical protein AZE42_11035 [Rhizopogon vesiculosus]|uniref:Major facilitator superfamily (MFS) profile domain-containing protein n=1 Tax=Rhizopogon vesiculosus TaxID=180088 RepID=A0A1J8PXZ6_9AGAM|nr:hypothetical protein AZE42_11035 [Rhizopogon vesiculosus]
MASIPDISRSTSEHDALLPERQHALSYNQFSPLTLLIPLAVVTRLTSTLPATTLLAVIQAAICRLWLTLNGTLPPDGHLSKELCAVPEVDKWRVTVISTLSILDWLGGIVACSAISFISSRLGRKPAILGVVAASILEYTLLVCSQYLPAWLGASTLVASLFLRMFTGPWAVTFIVNVYAVDISSAEERTPNLSVINGWATLGQAISFAIGGLITTKTNDPLIVYYISVAILGMTFIYVSAFLPESFPKEKRDALRRQQLARQNVDASARQSSLNRLISMIAVPFEPLKQLAPTRRADGRRNWRVAFCAIHIIIATLADAVAPIALLLLYVTKYGYNPAQTRTRLMTSNLSTVFTLTWMIPRLIRVLRPIYATQVVPPEDQQDSGDETVVSTSTDLLDVHITIISWVVNAVAFIMAATTSTHVLHLIAATIIGFSSAHSPIFRSLVVSSVNPLKQGEVLAAIEMISGIGVFLSPVVMGSILTATGSKLPMLIFYIHAAIVIAAASLLFLIRDSDRYQKPRRTQD